MTVTDTERQRIIDEHDAQKKEELRQRMSALGKSRSPKKVRAARKAIKNAREIRLGRLKKRKKQ